MLFVFQILRPWESDNTNSELLVMASFADEGELIGLSRLATHTTVGSGILLYQIPMYNLRLELVGEKKPRAKSPPSETSLSLRKSGFACVSWSLDWQRELKNTRMKVGIYTISIMRPLLLVGR